MFGSKSHAYVLRDESRRITNLFLVACHPEALFVANATSTIDWSIQDNIWMTAAAISGHNYKVNKDYMVWHRNFRVPELQNNSPPPYDERTPYHMRIISLMVWERATNLQVLAHQIGGQTVAHYENKSFVFDEANGSSIVMQLQRFVARLGGHTVTPAVLKHRAEQAALGHPNLRKSKAANAAKGYPGLAAARANAKAAGYPGIKKLSDAGHAAQKAMGYPSIKKATKVFVESGLFAQYYKFTFMRHEALKFIGNIAYTPRGASYGEPETIELQCSQCDADIPPDVRPKFVLTRTDLLAIKKLIGKQKGPLLDIRNGFIVLPYYICAEPMEKSEFICNCFPGAVGTRPLYIPKAQFCGTVATGPHTNLKNLRDAGLQAGRLEFNFDQLQGRVSFRVAFRAISGSFPGINRLEDFNINLVEEVEEPKYDTKAEKLKRRRIEEPGKGRLGVRTWK